MQASAPEATEATGSAAPFAADSAYHFNSDKSSRNAALQGKKRKRVSTQPATDDGSNLSKADVAQLLAIANKAKQINPETSAMPEPKSSGRKQQLRKAVQNVQKVALTRQMQSAIAASDVRSKDAVSNGKTKPPGSGSKLMATASTQAEALASAVSASDQAGIDKTTASPDAAAATGKQKKLGRNARLRFKRQAYRLQQQAAITESPPQTEAAMQSASPAIGASFKGQAAGSQGLLSKKHKPSQDSTAEALPDTSRAAASPAQAGATNATRKQKHSVPAAPIAQSAESPKALSGGNQKKKKTNLLEQMRSKLSGGRFRMLNEQLYTSAGQDAFQMMQDQPDLYQQYHEVTSHPACLNVWFDPTRSCSVCRMYLRALGVTAIINPEISFAFLPACYLYSSSKCFFCCCMRCMFSSSIPTTA